MSSPRADGHRPAIGVLGSAFNPPHLGHLALAQEALWQLGLDEVVLVPTGEAPHKRIVDDPGRELRLAMTRLAAADDPRFTVSTLEVEREGPSYTYETLELLARERGEPDLVFVMGADAAVGFESWREPQRVVELARLAVARRSGVSDADVGAVMRSVGAEGRATMLEMPQFGVSSSAVRERAAAGRPLRYLVPEAVARFIEEKGIYVVSGLESEALARRLAELADSKGASEIVVLDMRGLASYTDFLAICTARNERQARAIVDEVKLRLKQEHGLLPGGVEGEGAAGWIVLDYLDAVLHVFTAEERERYQLEDLWREAPRLELVASAAAAGWRPRAPLRCRAWVASRGRSSATAATRWMRRSRCATPGSRR